MRPGFLIKARVVKSRLISWVTWEFCVDLTLAEERFVEWASIFFPEQLELVDGYAMACSDCGGKGRPHGGEARLCERCHGSGEIYLESKHEASV